MFPPDTLALALWRPQENGFGADCDPELAAFSRTNIHDSSEQALMAAIKQYPERDVLLIQMGWDLPPGFLARMCAAWVQYENVEVLSPLSKHASISIPASAATEMDSVQFLYGEHAVRPCSYWTQHGSLWRSTALHELTKKTRTLAELNLAVLHGVYVAEESVVLSKSQPFIGDGKPVLLHVLHSWGGGVEYFARDLSAGDDQQHHLFLRANSLNSLPPFGKQLALYQSSVEAPLQTWRLESPIDDTSIASEEVQRILQEIIYRWGVGGVIVSSLIGHSLDVLKTGLPTVIACHDAYPYWPILHDRREPEEADFSVEYLQKYLGQHSDAISFKQHTAAYWHELKMQLAEIVINRQITCIAPSFYAKNRLCNIEPKLTNARWQVIEHGSIRLESLDRNHLPDQKENLRVLVPGHFNGDKGETLLLELLPILPSGIELILLGCAPYLQHKFSHPAVTCYPEYQREELLSWVEKINPDMALLPSLVPETFGYVLSEMLAIGLPVLCANIGAYAERAESSNNIVAVQANAAAFIEKLQYFHKFKSELDGLPKSVPVRLKSLTEMSKAWAQACNAKAPNWFFNYPASSEVQEESYMNRKFDELIEILAETNRQSLTHQKTSAEKIDELSTSQARLIDRFEQLQVESTKQELVLAVNAERLSKSLTTESALKSELLLQQKNFQNQLIKLHESHAGKNEISATSIQKLHAENEEARMLWERKLQQLESRYQSELDSRQKDIQSLNRQLQQLESRYENELDSKINDIQSLREQLLESVTELRDVFASSSWRITAIFRNIKTWFIK